MNIDHVVLWVIDPKKSVEFYVDIIGLRPLRKHEFETGTALFPSVRVNDTTILDLMDRNMASIMRESTGGHSGGWPINHICLSMNAADYSVLRSRVLAHGLEITPGSEGSFGAQGPARRSEYFCDPDGNVIEIRHY